MADEPLPEGEQKATKSWTRSREAVLVDMWLRRFTATEIAGQLGGTSRNAVIGKAHRLGMKSRPVNQSVRPDEERWPFLDHVEDPLRSTIGWSAKASQIVGTKWDSGVEYFTIATKRAIREARAFAENDKLLKSEHLLLAILNFGGPKKNSPLRAHADLIAPSLEKWRHVLSRPQKITNEILRWDVIDVLATAANLRSRLHPVMAPLDLPLILLAYLFSPAGQDALLGTSLGDGELEPFRGYALNVFSSYVDTHVPPSHREVAMHIWGEASRISRRRGPSVQRAGFESDSVDLDRVDPFVARDARALADLILLEAAAPPLAIGVFGTWGSGKSTLLAALKREIEEQALQEKHAIDAGSAVEDPATRRVAGVLQIELNAWTFADSGNLWASLTSDIFGQIAAGGGNAAKSAIGSKLVTEVVERSSKEAVRLHAARAKFDSSEAKIKELDKEIEAAKLDKRLSGVDAGLQLARDLLGAEEDTKSKSKDGADTAETSKESEASYLTVFRKAVLVGDEQTEEVRVRKYVDAGSGIARALIMGWDYLKSFGPARLALLALALSGTVGACYVASILIWPAARSWISWAVGSGASLLVALAFLAPAFRAAGLLTTRLQEKKQAAEKRYAVAKRSRHDAERDMAEASNEIAASRDIIEKYSDGDGSIPPPGLLLNYLLEDSSEIAQLRASIGTLGTVRRAFERLNAVLQEHAGDRKSPVQRIVIYLDDLDRCSQDQLVQIIEAIHLLLAFPCFIVVAAVDARWLQTALKGAHPQLAADGNNASAADYLEKIFQIAFWVRPLQSDPDAFDGGTYGRMIDRLAGNWTVEEGDELEEEEEEDEPQNEDGKAPTGGGSTIERLEPQAPDLDPPIERERVKFTREEVELFHKLGPIASRSPRAVKRMINIYRLTRAASVVDGDRIFVIAPEMDRVPAPLLQFALACEAGLPTEKMEILVRAINRLGAAEWAIWEKLMEGTPTHYAGLLKDIFPLNQQFDAFFEALSLTREYLGGAMDWEDLQPAFDLAGRYSFRMPPPTRVPEKK